MHGISSLVSAAVTVLLVLALSTPMAHAQAAAASDESDGQNARILIYSRTTGFRHDSIPTAIGALQARGKDINVVFDATEDPAKFTDSNLSGYDGVLFLSTTGDVLDDAGTSAFQRYLNQGGTFVGIHSASDTLRNETFYANELGALFDYHPVLQKFTVDVIGPSHPSTSMLPARWTVQDEAYNFVSDPRAVGATVILSADESTYTDTGKRKNQGNPHPTAWFQERGAGVQANGIAGRSFYTSLGHLNETWQDDMFMAHVLGGISWVLQGNTTRAFNPSARVGNFQSQQQSTASPSATAGSGATTVVGSQTPAATETHATQTAMAEARGGFSVAAALISVVVFWHFLWSYA